ncbi:MAG TPA: tRNA 2-selenouridine(34) synthase MnmH [Gammaproteobacteria bacterium]|nr:tRNA 2-selenouridine(34) synthase MnmH [Gammaproteobacteria bacterium]
MVADSSDYRDLFVRDTPLLDVRAPVEFVKGAFPGATNIPLLDDRQREIIGKRYKDAGQDEAIRLGLELATDEIREQRLEAWWAFCEKNPTGFLYCFRGGLRSRTAQQWLRQQGINYPLVQGGFKAMRRFLIDELEESARSLRLVCVSGLTGVGKTRVLKQTRHHVDLEGLANHRGSAFGRDALDLQPAVIDWENRVSIELLKHRHAFPERPLLVEDEGRRIGRIGVPDCLYELMLNAPRAILTVDTESRIRLISEDYIVHSWPQFQHVHGAAAETEFSRYVLDNLSRIQKRLGGERYKQVHSSFEAGLRHFFANGDASAFAPGIRILLEQYYDPMYLYQIERKQPEILFEGPESEFLQWAEAYCVN